MPDMPISPRPARDTSGPSRPSEIDSIGSPHRRRHVHLSKTLPAPSAPAAADSRAKGRRPGARGAGHQRTELALGREASAENLARVSLPALIPLLTGTNRDEFRLFLVPTGLAA